MKKKCGALPKFPNQETVKMRIERVVPKEQHSDLKTKTNQFIDSYFANRLQSESLSKCVDEALKSNEDGNI